MKLSSLLCLFNVETKTSVWVWKILWWTFIMKFAAIASFKIKLLCRGHLHLERFHYSLKTYKSFIFFIFFPKQVSLYWKRLKCFQTETFLFTRLRRKIHSTWWKNWKEKLDWYREEIFHLIRSKMKLETNGRERIFTHGALECVIKTIYLFDECT